MRRIAATTIVAAGLAACSTPEDRYEALRQRIASSHIESASQDLDAKASADKTTSEARGTKTCIIRQYRSAYLARKKIEEAHSYGMTGGITMSNIHARVFKDGSVGLAVSKNTYPGTASFFMIDGRRYTADGDSYAMIGRDSIESLKRDAVIKFSWTTWPYRNEANAEDAFGGFSTAYDECIAFLKG